MKKVIAICIAAITMLTACVFASPAQESTMYPVVNGRTVAVTRGTVDGTPVAEEQLISRIGEGMK